MRNNARALLLAAVVVAVVAAAALWWDARSVSDVGGDSNGSALRPDPTDQPGTECEIGRRYERGASHQSGCSCPEGYEFDVTIIGHEPCYGEGSRCPILEAECVESRG